MPRENDLEGPQDMGGKHGGQAGQPKSPPRPQEGARDEDALRRQGRDKSGPVAPPRDK
jgi:hypothetical protein